MNVYEDEFEDDHSDFDDRIEGETGDSFKIKDESTPIRDDDSYYRHLEEY